MCSVPTGVYLLFVLLFDIKCRFKRATTYKTLEADSLILRAPAKLFYVLVLFNMDRKEDEYFRVLFEPGLVYLYLCLTRSKYVRTRHLRYKQSA